MKIAVLPGDGIGKEIVAETIRVLGRLELNFEFEEAPVGGAGYEASGHPLPEETLALARQADAILFGSVGDPRYDALESFKRPEQAILGLRKALALFANLRPAQVYEELADASALRPEVVAGLDILIVRELTGDIYFGEPKGIRQHQTGGREGFDTMRYTEAEIRRIAKVAFDAARSRGKSGGPRVCSVDKANVLETSRLWREVVEAEAKNYPDIALSHMYVDNCAMQLVRNPRQFDVIVTGNLFGDILSDEASMLTGSIGMLPSASLDANNKGLYEPIHGSAPDIAGKGVANPLATILSAALMLRHSLNQGAAAQRLERAVKKTLRDGYRTADIYTAGTRKVGTAEMASAVAERL
ncbi:MAG: 3-isopropylmalate dehydrogenase [Pseudomonadota bacterium]